MLHGGIFQTLLIGPVILSRYAALFQNLIEGDTQDTGGFVPELGQSPVDVVEQDHLTRFFSFRFHGSSGCYRVTEYGPGASCFRSIARPLDSAREPVGGCFMIELNLGSESCSGPASRTLPALGGKMSMFERSESDILVRRAARPVDSCTVKRDMKHRNDESAGHDPVVRPSPDGDGSELVVAPQSAFLFHPATPGTRCAASRLLLAVLSI